MESLKKITWGIATFFLLGGGIYFSYKLKGIQFRFKKMFDSFKSKKKDKITPFQSLMIALAAQIGVGSLAGIALAIFLGGPGTLFWIWLTTILTAPNAFAESCLSVVYREKDGIYHKGGPSYYIQKGLGNKTLAKTYALLILLAYIVGFMTIQANTIAVSLQETINLTPWMTGLVLSIISFAIISKGLKGVTSITEKMVPIMGITYFLITLVIILLNIQKIPMILGTILQEAFRPKTIGVGMITTMMIGLERGIFATEAGLGSSAIASASADGNHPTGQGLIQILGVYFTSFIICTGTAFMILTSNYQELFLEHINGIELTQYAFSYHLGSFGNLILTIMIIFFAFSTIITGYYYGEINLKFLKKTSSKELWILKIATASLLLWGSVASAPFLWDLVDVLVALMAIINMYAVLSLSKDIQYEYNEIIRLNKP